MTTILVTGATGTVGSELVKQLTSPSLLPPSSGIKVRGAIHSQNKVEEFRRNNRTVEIAIMDFNKPQTVAEALNGVDQLFWLTLPRPNVTEEISGNLIREAKKNYIRQIVKLSVFQLVGSIGRWHRYEEKIIEESGIPYTFLRAGAFMQNFISFFGQTIKNQNAFYLPAGNGKVSFVDVRDIAAVAVKLLTENRIRHETTAFGITGQEALSYNQAAETLSKATGKKISYIDIPQEEAIKSMKGSGMEDWLIDDLIEFCNIIRAGNASQTTDTVEQFLGRIATSFEQFVRDHINSFN
jgi:uncharacterized protein YbjT (DUF2867 family)